LGVPLVYLNFEDVLKAPQVHSQGVSEFRIVIEHSGARVAFPAKKGSRALAAGWRFDRLFRAALVVMVNAHIGLVDMLLTDPALTVLSFVAVPEFVSSHLIGAEAIPPSALVRLILTFALSAPRGDSLDGTCRHIELIGSLGRSTPRAGVEATSSLGADLTDIAFTPRGVTPCLKRGNALFCSSTCRALLAICAISVR
jgi:hypothetical protein